MADPFINKLDSISTPGTSATQFLKKLGPIHAQWHSQHNVGAGTLGFLLFHWELIERFKKVGGPAHFSGVTAFTTQELASFQVPYDVHDAVKKGDVGSLELFSEDIEIW